MSRPVAVLACVTILAAGCATTPPPSALTAQNTLRQGGSTPVTRVSTEDGDVVTQAELRRSTFRTQVESTLGNIDRAQPVVARLTTVDVLAAEQAITAASNAGDTTKAKLLRNRYIGWLLHASNERCEAYKETLLETDRETNLVFGTLSTVLGILGGVFTPAATARGLSGAAGISSGLRAEFNSSFFAQKTAAALVRAMEAPRKTSRDAILANFGKEVSEWPFSAALADVQAHHDKCSLVAAFESLTASLDRPTPTDPAKANLQLALQNALAAFATRCATPTPNSTQLCKDLEARIKFLKDNGATVGASS
jgi:hypothetical protein